MCDETSPFRRFLAKVLCVLILGQSALATPAGAAPQASPAPRAAEEPAFPPDPPGFARALTAPGNLAAPAGAAPGDLPLLPSWNLVSLPNEPPDPTPGAVFAPLGNALSRVFAYDACSPSDPWKVYDPADPAGSTLTTAGPESGLWVEAAAAASLPSPGTQPATTTLHLCRGWNLIGFPASEPRLVQAALASINGHYARVFGYDPADAADPWEVFDVAVPAWANDLKVLRPGRGYWILMLDEGDLEITNGAAQTVVALLSPTDRASVTGPIDILGTAAGPAVTGWTLSYRLEGEEGWTAFASGNQPVENARLATFDPSTLINGIYEIELEAREADGLSHTISTKVVVEGLRKIGLFSLSFLDLEVPVSGLPIQVIRNYDSRDKRRGDFGAGWTLALRQGSYRNYRKPGQGWRFDTNFLPCQRIEEALGHLTEIRVSEREVYYFRLKLGSPAITLGGCFATARFDLVDGPLPGAALTILGNDQVLWQNGDDEVVDAQTFELFEPRQVRLTTRDGRLFDLDLEDGVTRVADLDGNSLTFGPADITHSSGRSIALERDAQGRITRITDPLGESLVYEYDGAGDLVTVTDRAGAVTRFTYDGAHNLLTVVDPMNRPALRNEYDSAGRLLRHIDAAGKVIEYSRDPAARQEVVTDRNGHSRLLEYDLRGNVVYEKDAAGNEVRRTFDARDNLLTETDAAGTTTYTYDEDNAVRSLTDPLGNRIELTYDDKGRLLTLKDPKGEVITQTFDDKGRLLSVADSAGPLGAWTYDGRGNLLSSTDAEGKTRTFEVDALGRRVKETDPLGHVVAYTYDGNGKPLTRTETRTTPSGPETLVWRFEYDKAGRLVKSIDPDGLFTTVVYDASGSVTEVIDRAGKSTKHTYDPLGRRVKTTFPDGTAEEIVPDPEGQPVRLKDRLGRETLVERDDVGRVVKTTYPDSSEAAQAYDAAGRIASFTDSRGNTVRFEYDAAGRRTKAIDALQQETVFGYDANGNQTSLRDPRGNTTTYEFDTRNRLVRIVYADSSSRSFAYNGRGQKIRETDPAGRTTQWAYDALGRLAAVTDDDGKVTTYAYDEPGNRIAETDANGNTTRFEYDALGRLVRRTLPGGAFETLVWDAAGRLASQTDFKGVTATYAYDAEGRLLERRAPDGTTTYTYTATGQRASATDARGTTTYEYDRRDRLERIVDPAGRELLYTYDRQGNRTAVTAKVGAASWTTSYAYDVLSRLTEVTDPLGDRHTFGYDAAGNRTSRTAPDGTETRFTYDALNRLTGLTTRDAQGTVLQSHAYTLGPAGHRTRVEEHDGTVRSYEFDRLHRLTRETVTGGPLPGQDESFTYDAVGNRLTRQRSGGAGPLDLAYSYDSRNRLLAAGGTTWSWDANGNQTARSGADAAAFAWTSEDLLARVTESTGTVIEHAYDADGNRVRTEVTPANGPPTAVDYLLDPEARTSQVLAEIGGEGVVDAFYVRAGSELLAILRPDGARYVHADGLGSIRLLTDETAAPTDRYAYSAFGELLAHEGDDPSPFRYAGEAEDARTGLYYLRARWMDPTVGRFASRDPFGGVVALPATLHKYLYAENDPVNRTDPAGLMTGGLNETSVSTSIQAILSEVQADYGFLLIEGALNGGNISMASVLIGPAAGGALLIAGVLVRAGARTMKGVGRVRMAAEGFRELGVQRIFKNKLGALTDEAKAIIWKLNPFDRGNAIELDLAATEYKNWYYIGRERNGFFPVIDFQNGKEVVSLKTVSRQDMSSAIDDLEDIIDELSLADIDIDGIEVPVGARILDVRVPPGASTQLNSLKAYSQTRGIKLKITEYP